MATHLRTLGFVTIVAGLIGSAGSAGATLVLARGIVSGLTTISPTLEIADAPPIGDLTEFRAFYAANAVGSGTTLDYDGLDPILESDLVDGAAHLFFLEKSGDVVLFVVYKRVGGIQSVDGTLSSSAGDFALADYVVRDAVGDTHEVVDGDLSTSHRITVGGRTDGYVAALAGRFDDPGDVLVYDMVTPSLANPGDEAFSSIQVFAGLDGSDDPIWVEIDAGPFPAFGSGRVELTRDPPMEVPGLSALGLLLLTLALGALGLVGAAHDRSAWV